MPDRCPKHSPGRPGLFAWVDWTLVEPLNALGALAVAGWSEDAR